MLLQAFSAGTVPIYFGNPEIAKDFNPKSFINCHDYDSFEDVIEVVKKLDEDNEQFLKYLCEPCFVTEKYNKNPLKRWGDFLEHIMIQEKNKAFRRTEFAVAGENLRKYETCASFWYIADHCKIVEKGTHFLLKNRLKKTRKKK